METKELQKFDPSTLMQGVRDRIKATFVSLIPDTQWEQLVQKEIDDFFKTRDGYGQQREWRSMSDFQKIVFEEFEKLTREKVAKMLEEYKSDAWENNQPKLSQELEKLIVANADQIFTKIIGSIIQTAINNANRGY